MDVRKVVVAVKIMLEELWATVRFATVLELEQRCERVVIRRLWTCSRAAGTSLCGLHDREVLVELDLCRD